MKKTFHITLLLLVCTWTLSSAQNYPRLEESFRLERLEPVKGKVRMVLDTDTYNEIDDQFALVYALLSPEKVKVEAVYTRKSSGSWLFLKNLPTNSLSGVLTGIWRMSQSLYAARLPSTSSAKPWLQVPVILSMLLP